jgi:uncharacterized protein YjiS (DUF1127 family)
MSTYPLAAPLHRIGSVLTRLPRSAMDLGALSRSRRGLARLDDHLLQDIGLTRAEALAEAERPVWDAPSHWKR